MWRSLSYLKKGHKKAIVYLNDLFFLWFCFYFFSGYLFTQFVYIFIIFLVIAVFYSAFTELFGGFSEVLQNYTAERLLVHAHPLGCDIIVLLAYFYEAIYGYVFLEWPGLRYIALSLLAFIASSFTSITLTRIFAKLLIYGRNHNSNASKVYIFGINDSARDLYSIYSASKDFEIIGFITFDKNNQNRTLFGKKIISYKKALKTFSKDNRYTVFLALGEDESKERASIINDLSDLAITVKSIPSYSDYLEKDHLKLEDLSDADILGREERSHNRDELKDLLYKKRIIITGAGGSIGSELSRIVATTNAELLFIDSCEFNLYKLQEHFDQYKKNVKTDFKLADIKDEERINQIFTDFKPEIIFHAAAYKHVPLIELNKNFSEAIKTNIFGTYLLCKLAKQHKVNRFVFVSTDKAVRPTNFMGATKRIAEKVIASLSANSDVAFSSVRFGNVLKSSGSVIPKFKQQIENGGPVTVTDENMTRYFMTISEAAELVIQSCFLSKDYSIYLLKMGDPVRIFDLAKKMINLYGLNINENDGRGGIDIIFTGARPGEKICEELLVSGNEVETDNPLVIEILQNQI